MFYEEEKITQQFALRNKEVDMMTTTGIQKAFAQTVETRNF